MGEVNRVWEEFGCSKLWQWFRGMATGSGCVDVRKGGGRRPRKAATRAARGGGAAAVAQPRNSSSGSVQERGPRHGR